MRLGVAKRVGVQDVYLKRVSVSVHKGAEKSVHSLKSVVALYCRGKKPEVKDNGHDLVDMMIMMEVEYSPLIVKRGTDIAHFDFLRDGRDRTLYGPVTKETLNRWIGELPLN